MLEKFVKDYVLWEVPNARAGELCEEEGAAEEKHYRLTIVPIHLHFSWGEGRRVGSEAEPGKKEEVGEKMFLD